MLETTEAPRIDVRGDMDEVRRLIRTGRPFILQEQENEDFRRFAARCGLERFREVFGQRPWTVQSVPRGAFQRDVPFARQTEQMPFDRFLERIADPAPDRQHYLNIWHTPAIDFAKPLFDELRALSPKIPLTRHAGQELRVFWLGGAGNVTPLHYDTYARSHGVVVGEKEFVLFPPDLRHYLKLKPYPFWSPYGWYSRLDVGPLDPDLHPSLRGTRPVRARCGPGDFLYLPPCWWHYVTIPGQPTISISATYTPRRAFLYWYHWRLRFSRWLGGQERLLKRYSAPKERTAAAA